MRIAPFPATRHSFYDSIAALAFIAAGNHGFFGLPPNLPFSRAAFVFALLLTLPRSAAVQTGQTKGVEHFLQRFMFILAIVAAG